MTAEPPEIRSGEVDYSIEDFRTLLRESPPRRLRIYRVASWILAVAALVAWIAPGPPGAPYTSWDLVYCLLLAAVLALFGSLAVRARWSRWQLRRDRLYAPQRFGIEDKALKVASAKCRSTIDWVAVDRVARRDDCVLLFVSRDSAYIVPRRAFDSDEAFGAFAAAAEKQWCKAHS